MSESYIQCSNGHDNFSQMQFCITCGEKLNGTDDTNQHIETQSNLFPGHSSQPVPPQGEVIPRHVQANHFQPATFAPSPVMNPAINQPASLQPAAAYSPSPKDTHCCRCGEQFATGHMVCGSCGIIKPIQTGHGVDVSLFQWAQDGQAMAKLRSIGPLVSMAKAVSEKVGKRWIESTFNGVRLSYKQMPHIYSMAVQAARILGLKEMPAIYVSGMRPWDALTFGSDNNSFIVMGSALVSCFRKTELMFLFAREMGHILAGHALWKTVIQFMVGEHNPKQGLMKRGVAGLLDPGRLIEGAIELPLLGWARQSEITADRAGLLAAAGIAEARKVLMSWSLKSPQLFEQINIEAWLEQQAVDANDENIRLAELVSSSTPYLTRRLTLMDHFESSPDVAQFRQHVMAAFKSQHATITKQETKDAKSGSSKKTSAPNSDAENKTQNQIVFDCPACENKISISTDDLKNKKDFAFKCPSPDCGQVTRLKAKSQGNSAPDVPSATPTESHLAQMGS